MKLLYILVFTEKIPLPSNLLTWTILPWNMLYNALSKFCEPKLWSKTLDHDQARARKRKKLCFKLSIAFFAFVLGVGLGIGLCSLFVHKVLFSGFLNSQAPAVSALAHRGIFSSQGSAWTAMSKRWKKSRHF